MKFFQVVFLFFLLLSLSDDIFAQQLKEDQVVLIQGKKYLLHQVRTGETIYSITRNYKVDSTMLVQNNPTVREGLKIGDILRIPYRENIDVQQEPIYKRGDPTYFDVHVIKSRKETPYFIAKQYGITVEELYAYNPGIDRFKRGVTIKIPVWEPKSEEGKRADKEVIDTTTVSPDTQNTLKIKQPVSNDSGIANYFEHIIESGETMWGITHKYNVTEAELKDLNPLLENGFPAGAVIKIPVKNADSLEVKPVNENAFQKYEVQKGETLYGLSIKFDIKISDIKKYNPVLDTRNLLRGETILIPKIPEQDTRAILNEEITQEIQPSQDYYNIELEKSQKIEVPESCKPMNSPFLFGETYNIALFLPFYIEANDTLNRVSPEESIDSMETSNEAVKSGADGEMNTMYIDSLLDPYNRDIQFNGFYGNSENYFQFYEGVLLAIDSMQKEGMNVVLNVYDTQNNLDSVRKIISTENFLKFDLIIGPVNPTVQRDVAALAAKNRIPMVSPLYNQSSEVQGNPYYFQVNPDRDYLAEKTAELVAEEYFNSNFIVFKTSNYAGTPEGRLVSLIQEKLYNSGYLGKENGASFSIYDFQNDGAFGLRRILSRNKENVIYIPSSNEGEISIAISNINNLAGDFPITLIGSNRYQNFESIEVEHFHNLKLEYVAPYWIDYKNPTTIRFVSKFKNIYFTEPNNFSIQGYDVTFYFLNAIKNYGRDFRQCLSYMKLNLIQGNYNFEKVSQFGGYVNHGVSLIEYEKNYDVVRKKMDNWINLANK